MKKYLFAALILSLVLVPACREKDTTGRNLTILCEPLKPYSFEAGGELKGITADLTEDIMSELDLPQVIGISANWDSLINLLKTKDDIVLFTTALTQERKDLFRWVGPVAILNDAFVGLREGGILLTTAEDAKKLPAVGVVTGYSTAENLTGLGFTNLVAFATFDAMVKGIFDGTVSVAFDDPGFMQQSALEQGLEPAELVTLLVHQTSPAYLAFSKNVSDAIIETWQAAVDKRKDNGFLQGLYDTYLPGTPAPGRVLMFTEENPPQSYSDLSGTLTGSSVDMVNAMMKGTTLEGPIIYSSWANCYRQIQLAPNAMAFSTLRSSDRENLFHWVGPVCKKRYCFYVNANSDYHIATIDAARMMRSVGTVTGWASEQELINLGFSNVVTFDTPQEVFQKLMDGDIPCAVLNDIAVRLLASQTGHQPKDYRKEAVLSEGQTYLAFSLDTDQQYLTAWANAYQQLVTSGELARIWKVWYPDIDW